MREIQGYGFSELPTLRQDRLLRIPEYIPVIDHASRRTGGLEYPLVAIDTYKLLRTKDGRYAPLASDGRSLRALFGLKSNTRILLRGVAKDKPLERYWKHRRTEHTPQLLSGLGIGMMIGPNFSHLLDVVRPDNMFNRKRQLICLDEINAAGINPVPHLNHAQPSDWNYWLDYLRANKDVLYVAKEFQTGNRNSVEGHKSLDQMRAIQDKLKRPLHLLLIGGSQFLEYAASGFEYLSLIDSMPFIKTIKCQRPEIANGKIEWNTEFKDQDAPLDELLQNNINFYAKWISSRLRKSRLHAKAS